MVKGIFFLVGDKQIWGSHVHPPKQENPWWESLVVVINITNLQHNARKIQICAERDFWLQWTKPSQLRHMQIKCFYFLYIKLRFMIWGSPLMYNKTIGIVTKFLFLILSRFKTINFYFPLNNKKTCLFWRFLGKHLPTTSSWLM